MTGDFVTFDGQRLAYRHWPAVDPHATVVYLHGIESHGGWFDATAQLLVRSQVEVYAPDRRGSGRNRLGRGHCRAYEHLLLDLFMFLRRVPPSAPVHLLGLSWGGKVAMAFAQHYPEALASVILLTPGVWPSRTLDGRAQWQVLWRWLRNDLRRLPIPLTPELFSDVPEVQAYIAEDSQRVVAVTAAFYWESRRLDRVVQPMRHCAVPVCGILSRPDRIINTPRTDAWLAQLTAPLTRTTIHDAGHALQLECPAVVADDVLDWIETVRP